MRAKHLLLCYFGSAQGHHGLHRAATLCEEVGQQLSVVLPIVDAPVADGCCGIQGEQWRRLTDEATRDDLERAVRFLESLGCRPVHVGIEAGSTIPDVVERAAVRWSCDAVAISPKRRPWSMVGLSRRRLRELRRSLKCEVVELRDSDPPPFPARHGGGQDH